MSYQKTNNSAAFVFISSCAGCRTSMGIFMVKVYIANTAPLRDEGVYRLLYQSMDQDRRTKADRFVFGKDKRLCIGAGALLRAALEREAVFRYCVAKHPGGKPYLVGNGMLHFNLSHSGKMVMCAISDREVGCDVEKKDIFDRKLANYVMTEREMERINQQAGEQGRADMFFRLWTLKESYMKATGLGILLEPKTFGLEFDEGGIRAVPCADTRQFHFREYLTDDGYCYACCALSAALPDRMTELDLRSLLPNPEND